MATNYILQTIMETIIKYPKIKFELTNEDELNIFKENQNGFNICIKTADRENTIYFENFHWHYVNNENETNEMLDQLIFGLTGISRIKIQSRNGRAYKWTLQIQDGENNWHENGTIGILNLNIFSKTEIQYLQNHLLPKEDFLDEIDMEEKQK